MKDPIQERLDIASAQAVDPTRKARVDAERAYHYARVGDFSSAREILGAIRKLPENIRTPSIGVWAILCDGIVEFFEDLSPSAQDRFRRAYSLSRSIGDVDLQALSSAWLAHAEFERRNYAAMMSAATDCISIFPRGHSSAHSRIYMVLANVNLYCANIEAANKYYDCARDIAVRDGDRATLGAIVYNKSVLMLNNLRLRQFFDAKSTPDLGLVSVSIETATSFQSITQNRSLEELPVMGEARLAMLKGEYQSAADTISSLRSSANPHRAGAKIPLLDVEYAVCLAKSGELRLAMEVCGQIDVSRYIELDTDDRIVFLAQIVELMGLIDFVPSEINPPELLQLAVAEFSEEVDGLRKSIEQINRSISAKS
jgi:tetratricopeptide (TPR) repeat protein